jgi:hypothetical protein
MLVAGWPVTIDLTLNRYMAFMKVSENATRRKRMNEARSKAKETVETMRCFAKGRY